MPEPPLPPPQPLDEAGARVFSYDSRSLSSEFRIGYCHKYTYDVARYEPELDADVPLVVVVKPEK